MLKEKLSLFTHFRHLMLLPLVSVLIFSCTESSKNVEQTPNIEVSKEESIQGSWRMVKSNVTPSDDPTVSTKMITDKLFFWYTYDEFGNVLVGAGGPYTYENGVYTEFVEYTLPGMKHGQGKKAELKATIKGDRLILKGLYDGRGIIEEVWERIK